MSGLRGIRFLEVMETNRQATNQPFFFFFVYEKNKFCPDYQKRKLRAVGGGEGVELGERWIWEIIS